MEVPVQKGQESFEVISVSGLEMEAGRDRKEAVGGRREKQPTEDLIKTGCLPDERSKVSRDPLRKKGEKKGKETAGGNGRGPRPRERRAEPSNSICLNIRKTRGTHSPHDDPFRQGPYHSNELYGGREREREGWVKPKRTAH